MKGAGVHHVLRAAALMFALLTLSGCTAVAPWQRGQLAQPGMAADHAPLQSARRHHVYNSRESATSSAASGGGSCGCY